MLISSSKSMKEVVALAEKAAKYPVNVLILGETGCGKELIARHIHETAFCDTNDKRTFASINCAALPKTLLESELFGYKRGAFTGAYANKKGIMEAAGNGSLLLDEIGDMATELQPKLLRVLDTKKFSRLGDTGDIDFKARVISTTNSNLSDQSMFRSDLYFRLSTVVINIPPLKERHDDIISLTNYFLGKIKEEFDLEVFPKINDDVYNILLIYSWPGNIRELQNVLKRAIILGDGNLKTEIIEAIINDNFTFFNSKKENEDDTTFTWLATNDNYDIREVEKTVGIHLIKTIIKNNPSISHANIAKKIGICTRTLRSRFEEHLN